MIKFRQDEVETLIQEYQQCRALHCVDMQDLLRLKNSDSQKCTILCLEVLQMNANSFNYLLLLKQLISQSIDAAIYDQKFNIICSYQVFKTSINQTETLQIIKISETQLSYLLFFQDCTTIDLKIQFNENSAIPSIIVGTALKPQLDFFDVSDKTQQICLNKACLLNVVDKDLFAVQLMVLYCDKIYFLNRGYRQVQIEPYSQDWSARDFFLTDQRYLFVMKLKSQQLLIADLNQQQDKDEAIQTFQIEVNALYVDLIDQIHVVFGENLQQIYSIVFQEEPIVLLQAVKNSTAYSNHRIVSVSRINGEVCPKYIVILKEDQQSCTYIALIDCQVFQQQLQVTLLDVFSLDAQIQLNKILKAFYIQDSIIILAEDSFIILSRISSAQSFNSSKRHNPVNMQLQIIQQQQQQPSQQILSYSQKLFAAGKNDAKLFHFLLVTAQDYDIQEALLIAQRFERRESIIYLLTKLNNSFLLVQYLKNLEFEPVWVFMAFKYIWQRIASLNEFNKLVCSNLLEQLHLLTDKRNTKSFKNLQSFILSHTDFFDYKSEIFLETIQQAHLNQLNAAALERNFDEASNELLQSQHLQAIHCADHCRLIENCREESKKGARISNICALCQENLQDNQYQQRRYALKQQKNSKLRALPVSNLKIVAFPACGHLFHQKCLLKRDNQYQEITCKLCKGLKFA